MKCLCGRFKPQPFAGAANQLVFGNSNFPAIDVFHRTLLGHTMMKQAFDFLIAPSLSTGKSSCKVSRAVR